MICGIDEAGRGAIAGPLVVSGVVLLNKIDGLDDSKKLSQKERERLFKLILKSAKIKTLFIENHFIDKYGISNALNLALNSIKSHFLGYEIIFDGNCNYGAIGINTLIKADAKILEVSAASIVSKVLRDRYMKKVSKYFPNYLFDKHKGYGTKIHFEMIQKHGILEIHRKSFLRRIGGLIIDD